MPGDIVSEIGRDILNAYVRLGALLLQLEQAQPPPPAVTCNCVCPMHRDDGMFCSPPGGHVWVVTIIGGFAPRADVLMCSPCASWWQDKQPHRVAAVRVEPA